MEGSKVSLSLCIVSFFGGILVGYSVPFLVHSGVLSSRALDDDQIRRLAENAPRGDPSISAFSDSGDRRLLELPDADRGAAVRDLILSLIPNDGGRRGILRHPNYALLYETGKSPVVIYVRSTPPLLEFEFAGWVYLCQDGRAFERRIRKCMESEKRAAAE
jgi:hypothetical protein